MTAVHGYAGRMRGALGLLRFPWPKQQASVWRLVFLCLGGSLAALPEGTHSVSRIVWSLIAIQACTLSAFFGTVLLNDIADRELDRVAHPERPLARGDVPLFDAVVLCAALYVITLAVAAFLSTFLLALISFWLSIPVATHYFVVKRGRAGRMSRSYSDLITPLQFAGLGTLVYVALENYDFWAMFWLAGLIYCSDASMNVLQAIRDEKADAEFRVSTVATRHGLAAATRVALALHLGVMVNAVAYTLHTGLSGLWLIAVLVVWLFVARPLWKMVVAPQSARLAQAIASTALGLQLVMISLGAVRLLAL